MEGERGNVQTAETEGGSSSRNVYEEAASQHDGLFLHSVIPLLDCFFVVLKLRIVGVSVGKLIGDKSAGQ